VLALLIVAPAPFWFAALKRLPQVVALAATGGLALAALAARRRRRLALWMTGPALTALAILGTFTAVYSLSVVLVPPRSGGHPTMPIGQAALGLLAALGMAVALPVALARRAVPRHPAAERAVLGLVFLFQGVWALVAALR
jgi:hypothetical protein